MFFRRIFLARIVGWCGVFAIGVLSLLPGDYRPHALPGDQSQWEHIIAYLLTGAALAAGYIRSNRRWLVAVSLTAYAVCLEIGQLWVPGRMSRMIDMAAGALGSWTGTYLVIWATAICMGARLRQPSERGRDTGFRDRNGNF